MLEDNIETKTIKGIKKACCNNTAKLILPSWVDCLWRSFITCKTTSVEDKEVPPAITMDTIWLKPNKYWAIAKSHYNLQWS